MYKVMLLVIVYISAFVVSYAKCAGAGCKKVHSV